MFLALGSMGLAIGGRGRRAAPGCRPGPGPCRRRPVGAHRADLDRHRPGQRGLRPPQLRHLWPSRCTLYRADMGSDHEAEIRASVGAHDDLGSGYDDAVAEGLVEPDRRGDRQAGRGAAEAVRLPSYGPYSAPPGRRRPVLRGRQWLETAAVGASGVSGGAWRAGLRRVIRCLSGYPAGQLPRGILGISATPEVSRHQVSRPGAPDTAAPPSRFHGPPDSYRRGDDRHCPRVDGARRRRGTAIVAHARNGGGQAVMVLLILGRHRDRQHRLRQALLIYPTASYWRRHDVRTFHRPGPAGPRVGAKTRPEASITTGSAPNTSCSP